MSDTELDRSVLDTKDREELHAIAGAMGVRAATRMKKADLIDAIVGATDTRDTGTGSANNNSTSDAADKPKRVRSRRASEADDPLAELAAEEDAIAAAGSADDAAVEPSPSPRTATGSDGNGGGDTAKAGTRSDTKPARSSKGGSGDGHGGTTTKPP